ncbi:hypothetical protein AB0L74_10670 [Streptomyces sp. NPDC052020]|uniref:hypothetical protein n=1 Tax=Streptomyces sp. NPDC052020 TaxID=3155677 RepID=UPI003420FC3B
MNTERPDHDDARTGAGTGSGRPARRRSAAVAAVAAVLLACGGGVYLAADPSGSGGRTPSGASDGTPPPLALDGRPIAPDGGPSGIAPGEPDPHGVAYRAGGALPEGPGSAPVHRAEGEVTREEVTRLAEALGVEGTPVTRGRSWTVGAVGDGAGPRLRVERGAPGNWTFQRYAPGPDDCTGAAVCAKGPGAPAGGTVSETEAKRAAAPVLAAAGQRGAALDARQVLGGRRVVNAEPEVGGLPTYGWTTGVTVGAGGEVTGGSGRLKAPVRGDVYPVLAAERTLALMNAAPAPGARGGIGGCAGPVPAEGGGPRAACEPSAVPRQTVTVERAVFGLAAHSVRGDPVLVPSWLFEVRAPGGRAPSTVTYPAVDPAYLAPAGPSPRPSGEPASPSVRDVRVEGYTAEGTELTVSFTGGVCAAYTAKAVESGDEVRVSVTAASQPERVCILIAQRYRLTVRLEESLGGRAVVGSDGEEIPPGKREALPPAPSGAR